MTLRGSLVTAFALSDYVLSMLVAFRLYCGY